MLEWTSEEIVNLVAVQMWSNMLQIFQCLLSDTVEMPCIVHSSGRICITWPQEMTLVWGLYVLLRKLRISGAKGIVSF